MAALASATVRPLQLIKIACSGERLGGNKVNISLAAASRADDDREKAEVIALIEQLTQEEVDRVIEKMQALFHGQQEKQEVAE